MESFDVIVVGAGPGGATAARTTALAGLSTVLIEKEKIPREKRCGGGLSGATLDELDFPIPDRVIERRCYGMWGIQNNIRSEVRVDHCVATMVTRSVFDAFLVEKAMEAGARVRDSETCLEVHVERERVVVRTEKMHYCAMLVIGGDGVYSVTAKAVRPKWSKREMRFCLVADIPLPKECIDQKMKELVELRYGYIAQGYAWAFPKKNHISYGIGGSAKQARTLKRSFSSYLALHGVTGKARFKGWHIPITEFRHDVVADRLMLCGDAAGFVDSFNGEGIHYAIVSGKMAGHTAVHAFKKRDFSKRMLLGYQEEFCRRNKRDMVWSARLTNLCSRFPRLVFGPLLADRPTILRYFKVMSGEDHFRDWALWIIIRLPWLIVKRFLQRIKASFVSLRDDTRRQAEREEKEEQEM